MEPLLDVDDIGIAFGGVRALDRVNFQVGHGEVLAVLGPNGAGKTTLFNCITGLYRCEGRIAFESQPIERMSAFRRTRLGIARTFQTPVLIESMTVLENVMLGVDVRGRPGYFASASNLDRRDEASARSAAIAALEDAGMQALAGRLGGELAHGLRKNVELVRAFVSRPRLLLLDEPASGLDQAEALEMGQMVARLSREFTVAVILVEHNVGLALGIADRVMVLDFGRRIALGSPDEVRTDPRVIAAYLGGVTV